MTDFVVCPDCGHRNPPGTESCEACNFPLTGAPGEPAARTETDATAASESHAAPRPGETRPGHGDGSHVPIPRHPLRRPARRAAPLAGQTLWLWLLFGVFACGLLIFEAVKANLDRAHSSAVEGSNPSQQAAADSLSAILAKDSTNVESRIALGDVLFDTGNWAAAVPHYRYAVRRDSSRIGALVDLGVCEYNLGQGQDAEHVFLLALQHDPHQPVALYNLGVVNEQRRDYKAALQYYHRALQSGPSEEMKNAIVAAVQRMAKQMGVVPPPLPQPGVGTPTGPP